MFKNLSIVTKILLGATVLGAAATTVSAFKDRRNNVCCECDEACCECELADPTAEVTL